MTNCRKLLERWEYQTILPVSWETRMQVKKQQLKLDMEQRTDSKLGQEYFKTVYCLPAYLTYMESIMQNTGLDEAHAGIMISGRNINNLRYIDDTTLMAENEEELKSLLMMVKDESEEAGLKVSIQKTKILACHMKDMSLHGK